MGDIKDLENREGLKKIKELAEDISICMMCTNLGTVPFDTRPMGTREMDENGNIWFLSGMESHKNEDILKNNRVQLIYSCPEKSHFLSVFGHAKIIKDREKTEEVWTVFAKAWFQEGKDDPNLTLIKFQPESAYYWDTKHGKMVSLIKIAIATVTGKQMDGGIEGSIEID